MKRLNLVLTMAGVAAALLLSVNRVQAQGGGGRANMDPAQFQQMRLDNYREQLEFTNDDEWNAVRPLIQKVMDAQQEANAFSGRGGRGGGGGGRGGFGGTPNPTVEALQTAIDSNSTDQMKAALEKYRAARKAAEAKLATAQDALKKVLTVKQEVVAVQSSLVN